MICELLELPQDVYETWIQLASHLEDVELLREAIGRRKAGAVHRSVPWEPTALALLGRT